MRKIYIVLISVLVTCFLFAAYGYYVYKSSFGKWKIEKPVSETVAWTDFIWARSTINGKKVRRTAMLIPCKIEGVENHVTMQFDIGSNLTMLYENSISSFYFQSKALAAHVKLFKFPVSYSKRRKLFKDLTLSFGDYKIYNESSFVMGGYGYTRSVESVNRGDTIHAGTIGADLFHEKVLIIDYPNQKIAICEKTPDQFKKLLVDIELDDNGRPVLSMILKSKKLHILFDNGSSLFPLTTASKNIDKFSNNPVLDSMEIPS